MGKSLLILFTFLWCYVAHGQAFQQRSNGSFTTIDVRSGASSNFYVPRANDTTLLGGFDTAGALLYVRLGGLRGFWYRDSGHVWTKTLSGSGSQYNVALFNSTGGVVGDSNFSFNGHTLTLYDTTAGYNVFIGGQGVGAVNSGSMNVMVGYASGAATTSSNNIVLGSTALYANSGGNNIAVGASAMRWTNGLGNVALGFNAGRKIYDNNNIAIGNSAEVGTEIYTNTIDNSQVVINTASIVGSTVATFISGAGLSVGYVGLFKLQFSGTAPSPYDDTLQILKGTVFATNEIDFLLTNNFLAQPASDFLLSVEGKYSNSIAIGQRATATASNMIVLGNDTSSLAKIGKYGIFDLQTLPTTGYALVWDGVKYVPTAVGGGGGGSYTFVSPLIDAAGSVSIITAVADGATKGAATFTAADFNSASGVISIDYANGQTGNGSHNGFISSLDWTAFNAKVPAGAITTSGLTMATARLLGRTTASTGAIQEITVGAGLTLSGGTLTASGVITSITLTVPTGFTVTGSPLTSSGTLAISTSLTGMLYGTGANTIAAATISSPLLFTGGTLSMPVSTNSVSGYLSAADHTTYSNLSLYTTLQTLTASGSITWNMNSGYVGSLTVDGGDTLATISNLTEGAYATLFVTQDATGSRTLVLPTGSLIANGYGTGRNILLSTSANAIDKLMVIKRSSTYYWTISREFQ